MRKRRFRPVVRLEVEQGMPEAVRDMLLRELQYEVPEQVATLGDEDVYPVERPDGPARAARAGGRGRGPVAAVSPRAAPARAAGPGAQRLRAAARRDRCWSPFPATPSAARWSGWCWTRRRTRTCVAIKLALYRTNSRSRDRGGAVAGGGEGKQVVALVELTARFDELSNIQWARHLRSFGIHVIYGMPGLKVHAKIALIVRREPAGIRRYAYIGTGNLNASTAAFYTDLGLMSADPALGAELNEVFNTLTGGVAARRLPAAAGRADHHAQPLHGDDRARGGARARRRRGAHRRQVQRPGGPRDDRRALPRLAAPGCGWTCWCAASARCGRGWRGSPRTSACTARWGATWSTSASSASTTGATPEYYIGSADWRTRNLSRRVEVAVPVVRPRAPRAAGRHPGARPGAPRPVGAGRGRHLLPAPGAGAARAARPRGPVPAADHDPGHMTRSWWMQMTSIRAAVSVAALVLLPAASARRRWTRSRRRTATASSGTQTCRVASESVALPDDMDEIQRRRAGPARAGCVLDPRRLRRGPRAVRGGPQGRLVGRVVVSGARNRDWEDMAIGPCPGGDCVYVADIGNNRPGSRNELVLYRAPLPQPTDSATPPAEVFRARFPGGGRDRRRCS